MNIYTLIVEQIQKALKELGIKAKEVLLEHPNELNNGDFSTNIAMMCAKHEGKNPKELAERIVEILNKKKTDEIEKIEVAGPGFINFHLSREFFTAQTEMIINQKEKWGKNETLKGKKVMVEYTDPNPFKEMHIGHLMANAIGESIARLIENSGAETIRANYQGDVGLHVAKAIYGMMELKEKNVTAKYIGGAYAYGSKAYESDDKAKETIDEINKKVYSKGDVVVDELYKRGREVSLEHVEEIYKKLGTKFDKYYFESEMVDVGKKFVEENKKVFEESDGAIVYRGEKHGLHTRVFITSEGLPTYETKDLGLATQKFNDYSLDLSITITAEEQKEYFKVMRAAFGEVHPKLEKKMLHITHGMMRLPSGKMSSRKGDVISAESLLAEVEKAVEEKMKDRDIKDKEAVAESISVGGLKFSILKQATGRDIIFDFDKALSFEGDSGPYLQYAHTRSLALLSKGGGGDVKDAPKVVTELERILYRFPEIAKRAKVEYEPHHVTVYLTELASAFNSWYANVPVIGGKNEKYGLALTRAFQITMQNGLWLLGIKTPEHM